MSIITFSEPSKLLDSRSCPSLENLRAVISSEWLFSTYMSGLLPHPGLRFHIWKINWATNVKRSWCKVHCGKGPHYNNQLLQCKHQENFETSILMQSIGTEISREKQQEIRTFGVGPHRVVDLSTCWQDPCRDHRNSGVWKESNTWTFEDCVRTVAN